MSAKNLNSSPEPIGFGAFHAENYRKLGQLLEVAARAGIEAEKKQKDAQQKAEELEYLAFHDSQTGALNRLGLEKHARLLKNPRAVLFVDGTNFKAINDRYGHRAGDEIIKVTYFLLSASLQRSNDIVGRWGKGDEFVAILCGEEPSQESNYAGPERRAEEASSKDDITAVRDAIAAKVKYLRTNDASLGSINFDLAVGAAEWDGSMPLDEAVDLAEADSNIQKAEQHKKGRHRAA